MQYKRQTHDQNDLVLVDDAKPELRPPRTDVERLRQSARDVPELASRENKPSTTFTPKKTMAGSVPGSEYWLG